MNLVTSPARKLFGSSLWMSHVYLLFKKYFLDDCYCSFLLCELFVSSLFQALGRKVSAQMLDLISHEIHRLLQHTGKWDPAALQSGWGGTGPLEMVQSTPLLKAGSGRAVCPRLCLAGFWVPPRVETHRLSGQGVCLPSEEKHFFLMFDQSFSLSCPRHHWEGPGSVFCTPPFRYLCTWACSRLNIPYLSASPRVPDSPSLKSPLWPFAGLAPVCPCLSCRGTPEPALQNGSAGLKFSNIPSKSAIFPALFREYKHKT